MTTLSKNLKRIMNERNLTFKEVGMLCGVSPSTVWKAANDTVTMKTVYRLALGLGVDVLELLEEPVVGEDCESSEIFDTKEAFARYSFYVQCLNTFFIIAIFTFLVWLLYV